MTTSELMKAMADAGAPFDAILIAVKALEEKDAEIASREADAAEKRAKDAERASMRREALPRHWENVRLAIFERDKWTCTYCGTTDPDQWHCDHITPLCRGGSNEPDNLTTACRTCNSSKGGRSLSEWRPG